jgi:hypothetical protein
MRIGPCILLVLKVSALRKPRDRADNERDGGVVGLTLRSLDLMKLLKLDSSLMARKQLAQELGYKGVLDGSAQMNHGCTSR